MNFKSFNKFNKILLKKVLYIIPTTIQIKQISLFMISIAILSFILSTTFSCTANYFFETNGSIEKNLENEQFNQKAISINVNISLPIYRFYPKTLVFEKEIDKVVVEVFNIQSNESIFVRDYPNINNISFEIPQGRYNIKILGYIDSGNVLYIHGEKLIDLTNAGSNINITIETELVSGKASVKVLPDFTQVENQTFEIIQATVTFINQLTEQILEESTHTANIQSIESIEMELTPGMWSTFVEILAKNTSNEIDVRYAKSSTKIVYIEPSLITNVRLRPVIPSISQIGEVVIVVDIHDGDTFKDVNNASYRIIGIDSPEVSAGSKPVGEFNQEAKQFLISFANYNGMQGLLRVINKGTDVYGRTLAYVFDRYGRFFYEEEICKSGYARPLFYSDNEIQSLTQRIIQAYTNAYIERKGIFSKWESAPLVTSSTINKIDYVGKIVWLEGLVTSITSDSNKYTIQLDDGWAKIEIRNEEYNRLFDTSLQILNNKVVKFYGELWSESGIYKILLRAQFEYLIN
ncbi:MAG: thermonuclease family protein [Fervidobacterium sp.]